ncbi:hypothetical protein NIES592_23885 [Fischerella major NIES-592]|uniref:Uncharacterized protein n=1 Tax=Fischerella major NIES-592 TaxID=210994 RepID=A0A1U7GSN1_9CYAN|nr:hypothetical protein NIES592_23885 [Fischerella major NIES-592]
MMIYCHNCEVKLVREKPEFRSKQDGWINEHWFPGENWKCIQCPSCNYFLQSHEKSWEDLEKEAILSGRAYNQE